MITYIIAIFCALLYIAYVKLNRTYNYWARKGVKGPTPRSVFGNLTNVFKKEYDLREIAINYYNRYPNEKYVGFYQGLTPTLVIRDPDCLKKVLIQDFGSFINHGFKVSTGPLSKNLFEIEGDDWRILRQTLSPIFTTGKLKLMMPILNNCVNQYMEYVEKRLNTGSEHEVKTMNEKYTIKSILSVAFGLDVDTFNDEKHIFFEMARKLTEPNNRTLAAVLESIKPGLSAKLITLIKPEVTDFFINIVEQTVKQRKGMPKRNDFIDLMIKIMEAGTVTKDKEDGVAELAITTELMAAQAVLFYIGGFDTSSSAMSFALHELAVNPEVQDRCYKEIKLMMEKYNGNLVFESLNELPYVTTVIEEALRKYPVAGELLRVCENKYTFPGTNLTIDKGTKLIVPVYSIQHDPKYFTDPEKFDPERFAPENRGNIKDCTYLPFGDGPRICIGMRFAKVQSMLGLSHFLYRYKVEPCEKSMKKLKLDPTLLAVSNVGGIWLKIKRR